MAGDGASTLKREIDYYCDFACRSTSKGGPDDEVLLAKIISDLEEIEKTCQSGMMSAENQLRIARRQCQKLRDFVERIQRRQK